MWARVENGVVKELYRGGESPLIGDVQYPPSIFKLWSDRELKEIGIVKVGRASEPPYNPKTQRLILVPIKVGGTRTREEWRVVELTAEEQRKAWEERILDWVRNAFGGDLDAAKLYVEKSDHPRKTEIVAFLGKRLAERASMPIPD